jgi:thiosulfate dehydrogenase [quinone] large subunit
MSKAIVRGREIQDPPFAQFLFGNPAMAWVWLVVRVWVGYQWITASMHKLDDPAWMQTGAALRAFWQNAVRIPATGRPPISFDWYRDFLNFLLKTESYTWFAKLVTYGELLVGIALVLGAFVGIAAFFGALMNWSFMMAGTASTNPVLFLLAVLLILAWKTAGYIGLDYYLLPLLGTPWKRGQAFEVRKPQSAVMA